MRPIFRTVVAGSATAALTVVGLASPALASHEDYTAASGRPGDETIVVPINDSEAGGTYYQPFERAYAGETPDGTPVFVYVPVGALAGVTGVHSLDPMFDHNTADKFLPCAEQDPEDYRLTLDQITYLGDQLSDQIVRVDEEHFGPMDAAVLNDPSSDSLVTLVYNVQDENYYDCAVDTYTAGYFAPEFMTSMGMNVITLDAFDWANRVGSPGDPVWTDDGDTTNDRPELYEGVIAHELEHLLMNYSDSGELSWVDEGLADMAAFLNGYDMTGSHLTYQQVFHRETSLTRWGGGLENYGASFSYFAYLWEQAGGNGDGMTPDQKYGPVAGDLLIKLIFENQADGMEGVQAAIDAYNADDSTTTVLRSAEDLFRDWAVAMYVDDEGSTTFDLQNFNLGTDSGGWTIDVANDEFWDNRGNYSGNQPEAKWSRSKNRPAGTALPFGVSYEKFRNPGRYVSLEFDGANTTSVPAPDGSTHFWGGYTSQSETILEANGLPTGDLGGQTLTFANWHFIEDGWDYGFVEALVGGVWQTVEVRDASGAVVSHPSTDDPHGANTEGNGITGTSGGQYFVDEPQYLDYSAVLPAGTTDVQFRYSTDAAYLDTGWFIDSASIGGAPVTLAPAAKDGWVETTGEQDNNWTVQVISNCDLTPSGLTEGETVDPAGTFVYRFEGDEISTGTFNTRCASGNQADFVVSVSNLPTGTITALDADYDYSVVKHRG